MNLCCKSTWGHVYDDNFTWVINLIPWLCSNIFLASTHDWEIEVVYFQRGQICGISAVRGLSPIWTSLGLRLFPLFPEAWKSKKTKAQTQFCKLPQRKCGSGALPTSVVSHFISSPSEFLAETSKEKNRLIREKVHECMQLISHRRNLNQKQLKLVA